MNIIRVHHGSDGQTHFEDIEWATTPTPSGAYVRTDTRKAGITMFAIQPPGFFADWHSAPSRRLVTMISGAAEINVSDGESRTVNVGNVILFEDVDGPGHTMRVIGNEDRVALHVSLDD
jgi:quercetin dioxygenase-like cupin family protein